MTSRGTTLLLSTQYLDEAETLADQIAILHDGRIIVNGTLAELKALLPPAEVTYVEKQPTLEDVFLTIVGDDHKPDTAAVAAVTTSTKEQGGIFERFHSMPVARSSVLWAHVLTSLVASLISLLVVVLVALLMGFRLGADLLAWLAVLGVVVLCTLALTWLAVSVCLTAKTVDGASAFSYPLIFLPFVSSAFVPTATMPGPVRWFAENQPVTSIVNAIRALLTQQPIGSDIWVALGWRVRASWWSCAWRATSPKACST